MPRRSHKLEDFAEQLGTLLGAAEKKARSWIGQREEIAKTLAGIRDTAGSLLTQLGGKAQPPTRRGRTAVPTAAPKRRRRRMSSAARAAVSKRMKAYWAARRKAKQ